MRWKTSDTNLVLAGIAGYVLFGLFFRFVYPESHIQFHAPEDKRIEKAVELVESLGYTVREYPVQSQLKMRQNRIRALQTVYGARESHDMMRDSLNVYFWQYTWKIQNQDSLGVNIGREVDIQDLHADSLQLLTTLDGRPVDFISTLPQDSNSGFTALNQKYYIAALRIFKEVQGDQSASWTFAGVDTLTRPAGILYSYTWKKSVGTFDPLEFRVRYNGESLHGFKTFFKAPPVPGTIEKISDTYDSISFLVIYLFFIVLIAIFFVKWLRADLLDLKSGILPAIVVLICWTTQFLNYWHDQSGWEILFGFVITAPFVCAAIWVVYSVGESVSRNAWPEKLDVLDKLRTSFLFPQLGLTLFRGLAWSGIGLALLLGIHYTGVDMFHGFIKTDSKIPLNWSTSWTALSLFGHILLNQLFKFGVLIFFFQAWLQRYVKSRAFQLIILIVVWNFIDITFPHLAPFTHGLVQNILIGFFLIYILIRYDILTAFIASMGIPIFYYGLITFQIGEQSMMINGIALLGLLMLALLWGFLSLRGRELSHLGKRYVPEYMNRIYAREQLKRELEIARQIQVNFLPRNLPEVRGLDIATLCVPAREVGGDYYDFVRFSERKLGVVIGDVSGKGIPAAFYMTLTKGLFQSQAVSQKSPKEILINLNRLFYENAERGIFISMLYTIFDLDKMTLTTARAGHNPMILRRREEGITQELYPSGMALGFDRGQRFKECTEETSLAIQPNDVFLIYTDGLNEAQNFDKKEFGESRLMRVLEKNSELSARDMMRKIQEEIRQFTAGATQHDDMTAVVVKIKEQL